MEEITFNAHGYTDTEVWCSPLIDRISEDVTGWVRRMCRDIIPEVNIVEALRGDCLDDIQEQGVYSIISCKPYPDRPKNKMYLANKDGLMALAKAAIVVGKKIEQAEYLKMLLSKSGQDDDSDENSSGTSIEVLSMKDGLEEVSSLKEILPEEGQTSLDGVFSWKRQDVILSASYARFCGLGPKQVNLRIRTYETKKKMEEGVDFFRLNKDRALFFCEANNVNLTSNEVRNGLFLLTQLGVNNLSGRLKNEKSEALRNTTNMAAAVIQDIERKGPVDLNTILLVLKSLSERSKEDAARYDRLMEAFEEASNTNNSLLAKMSALIERPLSLPSHHIESAAKDAAKNYLEANTYQGEHKLPPTLISNRERREKYFPGISVAVVSDYLNLKGHPSTLWKKQDSRLGLISVTSYSREGMEERSREFFRSLSYVKATECYLVFRLMDANTPVNIEIRRKRTEDCRDTSDEVRKELSHFIRRFREEHPEYEYSSEGITNSSDVSLFK